MKKKKLSGHKIPSHSYFFFKLKIYLTKLDPYRDLNII